MSDHGDHAVAEHDLTDLYVFRKPGDPAKTILVMNMDPDVGPGVPPRGNWIGAWSCCHAVSGTQGIPLAARVRASSMPMPCLAVVDR
jgi:hypothetical protein